MRTFKACSNTRRYYLKNIIQRKPGTGNEMLYEQTEDAVAELGILVTSAIYFRWNFSARVPIVAAPQIFLSFSLVILYPQSHFSFSSEFSGSCFNRLAFCFLVSRGGAFLR